MQAEWDANERVERNPLRWVAKRCLRTSISERCAILSPFLVVLIDVCLFDCIGLFSCLVYMFVTACGLACFAVSRVGHAGYRSKVPLGDDVPNLQQTEVDIVVERDRVVIGEDWGVLARVDDWLVYNGNRTHFALQWSHCSRRKLLKAIRHRRRFHDRDWLEIRPTGPPWLCVRIRPTTDPRSKLISMIGDWRDAPAPVRGEPTRPPATPHHDSLMHYGVLAAASGTGLVCLLACVVLTGLAPIWFPSLITGKGLSQAACAWAMPIYLTWLLSKNLSAMRQLKRMSRDEVLERSSSVLATTVTDDAKTELRIGNGG